MNATTFVDTSVLIYAHDTDAKASTQPRRVSCAELWSERNGVLSPQVLEEFHVNVTKKIPHPPLQGIRPACGEHLCDLVYRNYLG